MGWKWQRSRHFSLSLSVNLNYTRSRTPAIRSYAIPREGGIETVKSAQPILVFAVEGPHCRGTITILARRKTRASVEWNRGVEFARLPIARLARGFDVIDEQLFPTSESRGKCRSR